MRSPLEEMMFGAMAARVVCAAADLEVADLLADDSRTSAQLADRADAHQPSLLRLLRALTGLGVVAQVEPDRFELTELGGGLRAGTPDSIRALVAMLGGPEVSRSWGELTQSVRTGALAFELAHGVGVFEFYKRNPELAATFNAAMAQHSRYAAPGIVAGADFSRFRTVVDVGGGNGTLIAEVLRAEPDLEGVVYDLPQGLESAARTLAAAGVAHRCRLEPGDFFASVPAGADAYVLKQVLHDWDDEQAAAILRNCREAMVADARVLILERTLPELVGADDLHTLLLDILMMVVPGGRERTEQEFRELLSATGLTLTSVSDAIPPFDYRVIEAAAME